MSNATISQAATTRHMFEHARELVPPPGWQLRWTVEMLGSATDPYRAVGRSDFDTLEDALDNFRRLRAGRNRVPARIVARLTGPAVGVS
jgi:hypothetical protein